MCDGTGMTDLVTGKRYKATGGSQAVDAFGVGWKSGGAGTCIVGPTGAEANKTGNADNGVSVIVSGKFSNSTSTAAIANAYYADQGGWVFKAAQYPATNQVGFGSFGVADYASGIATPTAEGSVISVRAVAGTTQYRVKNSTSSTANATPYNVGDYISIGAGFKFNSATPVDTLNSGDIVYWAAIFDETISAAQADAWHRGPFGSIVVQECAVMLVGSESSGSSTSLTIQDMAHGVAIDNITLTSQTALIVNDMLHAVAIEAPVLTTATVLAIADLAHALATDNLALTLDTSLAIADLAHALTIDNIVLTSQTALAIADLAHALAIDNLTLSTAASTDLVIADMAHALGIDNLTLTLDTTLAINELAHALTIDNLSLTLDTTLAIAELAHALAIDNLTLTPLFGTNLLIDDMTHAVAVDNMALTLDTSLIIADLAHALALDNIVLTSATALAIADMLHGVSIDNLTLSIPGGGYSTLDLIFKILTNRQELSPTAGTFTLYDDDSTTVLYTAAAWADTAGTVPYSGGKLQRIDALQ